MGRIAVTLLAVTDSGVILLIPFHQLSRYSCYSCSAAIIYIIFKLPATHCLKAYATIYYTIYSYTLIPKFSRRIRDCETDQTRMNTLIPWFGGFIKRRGADFDESSHACQRFNLESHIVAMLQVALEIVLGTCAALPSDDDSSCSSDEEDRF